MKKSIYCYLKKINYADEVINFWLVVGGCHSAVKICLKCSYQIVNCPVRMQFPVYFIIAGIKTK